MRKISNVVDVELRWRPKSQISGIKPEDAYKRLIELERQNGIVTPESVVESAYAEDDPLHDYFEWDDQKAGRQYRKQQSRHLIASLEVIPRFIDQEATEYQRVYINVVEEQRGYHHLKTVVETPDFNSQYLEQLYKDLNSMAAKLERFEQLVELGKDVRKVAEAVKVKAAQQSISGRVGAVRPG